MEPFEPPKYIEKLIAAINDGAKSAQLGALAFTAIGVFLLATAFSATDEDLLLNRALTISQLGGTAVPVVFAFGLAPAVFVAAHFYTLIRYDMLAGNVRRFRDDLAVMVGLEEDRDRCRQLLANVEFVNALAMPKGSRASSWMFDWTVRALLAVFPVLVLLFVQLQSLRLQSEWVNWTHHACILADLVLLVWFFGRLRDDDTWHFRTAPTRRIVELCWMPLVVIAMDLAWLRVPGPNSNTAGKDLAAYLDQYPKAASFMQRVGWWSEFHPVDLLLCTPGAWGCRFLTVTHRVIVAKVWDATTFVAVRAGAELDRTHLAAFEAASLSGRSLRFADLTGSELFSANLSSADLRHAVLAWVTLKRGDLSKTELQGADLLSANLEEANLFEAHLQNANITGARLTRANLLHAQLQGSTLNSTQMEGAVLNSAGLEGADLSSTLLWGASLYGAGLQGADLRGSRLQSAVLQDAQLQGADLSGAQLGGADLRRAGLWNATTDLETKLGLADLREVNFHEVSAEDLIANLPTATPEAAKQRLRERLAANAKAQTLLFQVNTDGGKILVTNPHDAAWQGLDPTTQLTSQPEEIDPAVAELLAGVVAPAEPDAAEAIASRVTLSLTSPDEQGTLIKLLGCRLQAQVHSKRVTLHMETIESLRRATGPCDKPSP